MLGILRAHHGSHNNCLLYTSDAADERSSVDLGGRRIFKKKNKKKYFINPLSILVLDFNFVYIILNYLSTYLFFLPI